MRYDYQCYSCGTVKENLVYRLADFQERRLIECESCKRPTAHTLVIRPPAIEDWGQGRYFEHLSARGETFYDKASYKRYLKEHGLIEWSPKKGMPGQVV